MKTNILVGGCIILCTMGTPAYAQSSVTIYGLLETGVTYASNINGESSVTPSSGHISASRIGFRGNEDLGGGSRAIFTLENGFNINTGALSSANVLFNRQAFVGLSNIKYGTITLGRQYDPMGTTLSPFGSALMYNGFYTCHMGNIDRAGGERVDNSIKYASPSMSGFTFEAMYGVGGRPGNVARGNTSSLGAKYANGNFAVGAAMLTTKNTSVDLNSVFAIRTYQGTALAAGLNGSTSATQVQASSTSIVGIGSSYVLGNATIAGMYTQTSINDATAGQLVHFGDIVTRIAEVGVNYRITPAATWGVDYTYTKLDGGYRWQTLGTIIHYYLSKRTNLYAQAAHMQAGGAAQYANIVMIGGPSSTANQWETRVGIRHTF